MGDAVGVAVGEVVHALQWPGHVANTTPVGSAQPPALSKMTLPQMAGSAPSEHVGDVVGDVVGFAVGSMVGIAVGPAVGAEVG